VELSKGLAECCAAAMCSSTGGGRYALFFAPKSSAVGRSGGSGGLLLVDDGEDSDVDDDEDDSDHRVDVPGLNVGGVKGDGGIGDDGMDISTLSSSPASSVISPSSSSVEGKKLRNSASACHFDAFLNSTHTSIRPGLESAGSSRSIWLVVLYKSASKQRRQSDKNIHDSRKQDSALGSCNPIQSVQ
jgi:hypothetical protein